MTNRKFHCMPLAGQLVDTSNLGFIPLESVATGAASTMRKVSDRGITPKFFEHVKGLSSPGLGDAARQLNQAYCDALDDPLANATHSVIAQQTSDFATSIGMTTSAPKPTISLPKRNGLQTPRPR